MREGGVVGNTPTQEAQQLILSKGLQNILGAF